MEKKTFMERNPHAKLVRSRMCCGTREEYWEDLEDTTEEEMIRVAGGTFGGRAKLYDDGSAKVVAYYD